jgi:hypothetical protein
MKGELENGDHSLSRHGQESSAADMEDIEIDADRFMSFCIKFKYLGSYFVRNSMAADILNGSAKRESYSAP